MKFDSERIAQQLRLGEDSEWEFKEIVFRGDRPVGPRRNDLADEIAAFANGDGGILLCGVRDSGEVVGMSRAQLEEVDRLLVEVSTDAIDPPVRIKSFRREVDGKGVLLVEVPAGDAQHDSPGGSFVRVGASKRHMKADERLRLAQKRGQSRYRWFDEQAVPETGFGTLDPELWKPLLTPEGATEPRAALQKSGLLVVDETGVLCASVAGVLVASREPEKWLPNACITATRYRGTDRASGQTDAQTIGGSIDQQIAGAISFVTRNMAVAAEKIPARAELPEYSPEAVFEAVVNAVVHRDYGMRMSRIRLSLFADRLEIQSPGGLPNNLTVAAMPHRQATRNERIASLLGRLRVGNVRGAGGRLFFVEKRGDGVPIIRRTTRGLTGRYPEFRLIQDSEVCVVIPAATLRPSAGDALITARCGDSPLAGVRLFLIFPDGTTRSAATDEKGEARLTLHLREVPVTVFAAREDLYACVEPEWRPISGPLVLDLEVHPNGGSVIFEDDGGQLPGLTGRLTPVQDASGPMLVYGAGLAINEGKPQPVSLLPGEEMLVTDAVGRKRAVRVLAVRNSASLVEYRTMNASSLVGDSKSVQ